MGCVCAPRWDHHPVPFFLYIPTMNDLTLVNLLSCHQIDTAGGRYVTWKPLLYFVSPIPHNITQQKEVLSAAAKLVKIFCLATFNCSWGISFSDCSAEMHHTARRCPCLGIDQYGL